LTIVICAKNEDKHLKFHLPHILQQEYPTGLLNVLVVDDGSEDQTAQTLQQLQIQYPQLNVITIDPHSTKELPGKKQALKVAIDAVHSDFILLTDADCYPTSDLWAQEMVQCALRQSADVVLGLGRYEVMSNDWLNSFIQFETLHTAIQYASYATIDKSYMGVGRNLLYKTTVIKHALEDPTLLTQMRKTSSGDDDLMVTYCQSKNLKIQPYFSVEAQTISTAPKNIKSYYRQKSRHTSSSKYYDIRVKALLGFYALSHGLFWLSFFSLIIYTSLSYDPTHWDLYGVFAMALVIGIKMINYHLWIKLSDYKHNALIYIIIEPIWLIYNVILSPFIFWKNTFRWK